MVDLINTRLKSQHITIRPFESPVDVVSSMGAMQAQDYAMLKWAIGLRLSKPGLKFVDEAFDKGEIVRTHLMRPTWHVVAAADLRWLLNLTAPRIKSSLTSRHRDLGLTTAIISSCLSIVQRSLENHNHLTREELISELEKTGIDTGENRASHILMMAELDNLICSGKHKNGKPSYALMDEWVPKKDILSREDSLKKLAITYFSSHGPATIRDFTWWSGLNQGDAMKGIESASNVLISETIDGNKYWMGENFLTQGAAKSGVFLLPAFDEYLISYADRKEIIIPGVERKAISDNGVFRPVVIENGKIIGIWKRTTGKQKVKIGFEFFNPVSAKTFQGIRKQAELFGKFLSKEVVIEEPGTTL
ncbi:MAG: AlkZ family DNA glycosylase [Bacteroidales bacterium]|nr:AlkZ family DNA glycosylase [Bacteroidales bacterium]